VRVEWQRTTPRRQGSRPAHRRRGISGGCCWSFERRNRSADLDAPSPGEEERIEQSLRPARSRVNVGQEKIRGQLEIFIQAQGRSEALDHVLLFGPPGLARPRSAHIIAKEMGVNLRQTSGPVLERPGDLAALLTNLRARDVLFIDEIHRLSPIVEEILYPRSRTSSSTS